ncbi:MAG: PEP-CTERM sorting domain-containing protein [Armatimonadetes bacterium]|nr:PEP-CTERM sorting domain-containing protein [Armatimonadota bacterium]
MKLRIYMPFAALAIACLAQADITSYNAHTNQVCAAGFYDTSNSTFFYPHFNGGSPAWINLNDSFAASGVGGKADYDIAIQAADALDFAGPYALQFSGSHHGHTAVQSAADTYAWGENFTDQYLDFNLNTAGTVTFNFAAAFAAVGYTNNWIGIYLDGNQLAGNVNSYVNTVNVGVGNHTVRMEIQNEAETGPNLPSSSYTSMDADYTVLIQSNPVPEPASMLGLGGLALAAIRRRKRN